MEAEIGTRSVLAALGDTLVASAPTDLMAGDSMARTPMDPESGRYALRECLGRGGLGEVHEAFDRDLRRVVALKTPRDAHSSAATTMLIREAQITAQLEHPGVPSVHGLGLHADQSPFFTMTLVRGQTLSALIAGGLSERRVLRLFVQLAYALAFAHERGVVHRDLKPDNIMVGAFGEVRLMDWGIAKLVGRPDSLPAVDVGDRAQHQSQAGAFVGTPGFAAPEQIAGREDLDARADIFALGAVLFEALSGRPLFQGSAMERIHETLHGERSALRASADLSVEVVAIIGRATAHERDDRYASVIEMIRDVEAYLDGEPVRAFEPTWWQRARGLYHLRATRARRFRALDLDLIITGHALAGAGAALSLMYFVTLPYWLGPIAFVIGMVAGSLPAYTLFRRERVADVERPSVGLSEGLRSRPRAAAGDRTASSGTEDTKASGVEGPE